MSDIFGYKKTHVAASDKGAPVSAAYAVLGLSASGGDGGISMIQQFNAEYVDQVQPRPVSGSNSIYWQSGMSSGSMNFSRLVTRNGFFKDLKGMFDGACGKIQTFNAALRGDGVCEGADVPDRSSVQFTNSRASGYSLGWSAQGMDVTEGAAVMVGDMKIG